MLPLPKLLILHNLPAEYYPPLTNLIRTFADWGAFELVLVVAPTPEGMEPFRHAACRIVRYADPGRAPLATVRKFAAFARAAWREMFGTKGTRPSAILSFEPHSALPVVLARLARRRLPPLFMHHHEFYRREDFSRRGSRIPRLLWLSERRWSLPEARWISQTNEDRLEKFARGNPRVKRDRLHVLPNYPPRAWRLAENEAWKGPRTPLRIVYVGSVSLEATFIAEAARWVASHPEEISLDVFCQHAPDEVVRFFAGLGAPNVRFDPDGIPYEKLPERLVGYHVGLVLYRGATLNFVYNRPNKVFEYLACGLDVWYPREMLGMEALQREEACPRIVALDFERLSAVDLGALSSREGLPSVEKDWFCETALEPLHRELRETAETGR